MIRPIFVIWTLALATVGCSGDHTTNSHPSFPTLNLSDKLVVRVSDSISASAMEFNDTAGLLIPIPESLLADYGSTPDIYLSHFHRTKCYCLPDRFEVLDPSDGSWDILDDPFGIKVCTNDGQPNRLWAWNRLLSPWEPNPLSTLLDSEGRLRVRGNFDHVDVRVVSRTTSYFPRLVAEGAFYADLAWSGDKLIVVYGATRRDGRHGWIEWRDRSGATLRSEAIAGEPFYQHRLLIENGELWTLSDNGLQLLSESGEVVKTIGFGEHIPLSIPWHMAFWKDGYLWTAHNLGLPPLFSGIELIGMDPGKSLDSGYTIFGPTMPFPGIFNGANDIEWDGEVFRVLKSAYRYLDGRHGNGMILTANAQGEPIDTIPMTIIADCIAWDGEAYWIAHHGTPDLPSTDILLSRFYPR